MTLSSCSPDPVTMAPGRDDLLAYPRPSIAADVVLLTVADGELNVVLRKRDRGSHAGEWMLPGTMLRERERLSDAVLRCLETRMHIQGRSPRQLHVFDDPDRDERGWVLTVTHLDVLPLSALALGLEHGHGQLRPVSEVRGLPFSHDEIIAWAVRMVRWEYQQAPDPWNLLDSEFTMTQLRQLHDAVVGAAHQKDTFRRAMEPQLDALQTRAVPPGGNGLGRPARIYRKGQGRYQPLLTLM
ncbi:NUDIX domain-containing protein [Citricoccus sp. GCM10030269]|uniref:NrtR DNA-binding winged helix domain-containing protein n=1 Tax=Citricoccus sp. GCM10030269 TaxID=3273388 RepID=UPI00360BAAC5